MALIDVKNASFGYDSKPVIKGVNFSINDGDYLCIIGENGAGKSTIMKTILGLIPIITGEIFFNEGLINKQIGYLPQQTDVQRDFPASVIEVVLSGFLNRCIWRPFYNSIEKNKAKEIMERLGISQLSSKCYRELSGGQQQRVLLARALCATQKILLLDEPVAGLDPQAADNMYNIIKDLHENTGITIVMVSHDTKSALNNANHVLQVKDKKIIYSTKNEYLLKYSNNIMIEAEEGDLL